jgi:hypothetical protein
MHRIVPERVLVIDWLHALSLGVYKYFISHSGSLKNCGGKCGDQRGEGRGEREEGRVKREEGRGESAGHPARGKRGDGREGYTLYSSMWYAW